jgi:hypothetical protein
MTDKSFAIARSMSIFCKIEAVSSPPAHYDRVRLAVASDGARGSAHCASHHAGHVLLVAEAALQSDLGERQIS